MPEVILRSTDATPESEISTTMPRSALVDRYMAHKTDRSKAILPRDRELGERKCRFDEQKWKRKRHQSTGVMPSLAECAREWDDSYLSLDVDLLERGFPSGFKESRRLAGGQPDVASLCLEERLSAMITYKASRVFVGLETKFFGDEA